MTHQEELASLSVYPSDFNKFEPRDALGRWVSSGLPPSPGARLWRAKPLSSKSARRKATLLANHTYLSLPPALRPAWGWDNDETIDALSEVAPIWADASDLNNHEFRDRYLTSDIDLRLVHQLRTAVGATVHAQTYGDLADASVTLADVFKRLGPDDWPHILASAQEQAKPSQQVEPTSQEQNDWVRLPPGERNDALGSLLEWVANATPADASFLRQEIKQTFYDVGDKDAGDALNAALSTALEPGVTRQDREGILETYERYTHGNPADAGAMRMLFVTSALLLPGAPKNALDDIEGVRAGEVRNYTDTIKWGIRNVRVRSAPPGFWGERLPQGDPDVDAYELQINPNNESYYLPHPNGGYVQFENMASNTLQDGKLVTSPTSIYYIGDKPIFLQQNILAEATRQVEAASFNGLKVEWLVSNEKAATQLEALFSSQKTPIPIKITYLPARAP